MNDTTNIINGILDQIRSNVNLGTAYVEDEAFIETIEDLNAIKYLLSKEFERQMEDK